MPSLSVCLFSDRPARWTIAALRDIREIAAEIVVALDERVPPEEAAALRTFADVVVRATFDTTIETRLTWLHGLCSSDWVLRLDSDELPSAALLDRLQHDDWHTDVTHAYLNRTWLWPDRTTAIHEYPWFPDPQLRFVRREGGTTRFVPVLHHLPHTAGFARMLAEPVLHLDLLLQDEPARAGKAERYERVRPDLVLEDGRPLNPTYYVPERAEPLPRTVPLDLRDATIVDRFFAAAGDPGDRDPGDRDPGDREPGGHVPDRGGPDRGSAGGGRPVIAAGDRSPAAAGRGDAGVTAAPDPVDALVYDGSPPPPPGPGEVELALVHPGPARWVERSTCAVVVEVANRGTDVWNPHDAYPVRVGAHLTPLGEVAPDAGLRELRAELPCPIRPGRRELVWVLVGPLPAPGPYRLEVGVVRDGVAWSDAALSLDVLIRRGPGPSEAAATGAADAADEAAVADGGAAPGDGDRDGDRDLDGDGSASGERGD